MRRTPLAVLLHRQVDVLATTLRSSTIKGYRGTLRHFLEYLARQFPQLRGPGQLRRDPHLLGWLQALWSHQPPWSASLRIQRVLHLRGLLDALAMDHPEIPYGLLRPGDVPRKDHYLPRPLSIADDQSLQQHLRSRLDWPALALLVMRYSGVRIGELVDLADDCLRQLGPERWSLHVPIGKLHSERWVPVDDALRQLILRLRFLRSLPDASGMSWQGPFLLPRPRARDALISQLRDCLKQAAQASGISANVVPHQLRHTYATEMLRAGVSFPAVMKLLGHTSPEMTLRYVQISQADLQREYLHARTQPRHLVPPLPLPLSTTPRSVDLPTIIRCLQTTQRLLEALHRDSPTDQHFARFAVRLSRISTQLRKITETEK
jgi:integrase